MNNNNKNNYAPKHKTGTRLLKECNYKQIQTTTKEIDLLQ